MALAADKNSYDAKTIGDTGFTKFANEVNVIVPGSYADQHELMKDLLNKPVIVLIKDSDCPADMWYQVGSACVFAYISPAFETGTTKESIKGYKLKITNTASKVYLYQGEINYIDYRDPLIARLEGEIIGTTVNLDASESSLFGTVSYEYTVYYNDVNFVGQSIILPDNADLATFDTSLLVNWNQAGFAVMLKITNEFEFDTTLSSDSSGERPYIAGGVDEGFDQGFDFNI